MKRAALYARVSTDEQQYAFGLPSQVAACQEIAPAHDCRITHILQDHHTGTVLDRPELTRLRDLVARGDVDAIICHDIDRLARRLVLQLVLEDEFERAGVELIYVRGGQKEDTPEGRFMAQVRGAVAELDRAKIVERMMRGKRQRAMSGQVLPGRHKTYGYCYVSGEHTGQYEPDPAEAEVVRLIFEWYVIGDESGQRLGASLIAQRLTEMGVPAPGEKGHRWGYGQIGRMLANETYAGTLHWNKDGHDRSQWIAVPVPAIISRELFDAARRQAAENMSLAKRNTVHEYLLRSRLTCADCGKSFRGSAHGTAEDPGPMYYRCLGQDKNYSPDGLRATCHHSLRADAVEAKVWEKIKALLQDPDALVANIRAQREAAAGAIANAQERLQALDDMIAALERQQARLLRAYTISGDDFPETEYRRQQADLGARRAAKIAERNELGKQVSAALISDEDIAAIERGCRAAAVGIEHADFALKAEALDMLNVHGVVQRGERRGDWRIQLSGHAPYGAVEGRGVVAPQTSQRTGSNNPVLVWMAVVEGE